MWARQSPEVGEIAPGAGLHWRIDGATRHASKPPVTNRAITPFDGVLPSCDNADLRGGKVPVFEDRVGTRSCSSPHSPLCRCNIRRCLHSNHGGRAPRNQVIEPPYDSRSGLGGLLAQDGYLRSEDLVFRNAYISTDPVLINRIHDEFVSELIATDKKLHRFVVRPILFLKTIIVDLDCNTVLMIFRISLRKR